MDWIGAILILLGIIITGRKKNYGWIITALGGLVYLFVGIENNLHGMVFMEICFIISSVYNFFKWKNELIK